MIKSAFSSADPEILEIDYIKKSIGLEWIEKLNEILKIINGLSKYHRGKTNG